MRTLVKVDEFRQEAANALFTRQQAMGVTIQLLTRELREGENSQQDTALLEKALKQVRMDYLDPTATETDLMLDSFNVARFTSEDVLKAIHNILFDVG